MSPARFFTFDGIDGTGKSTQSQLFCDWLREIGHEVVTCRDPGSTLLGEKLRELILHDDQTKIGFGAETLMYMAARAQLVTEIIRPALEAGKTVVSDRFLLANVAYQAYGGELPVDEVWQLGDFATGSLQPHCTFLLDLDVRAALARLTGSGDRLERRGLAYFDRVRQGFLAEAACRQDQIVVIDAGREVDAIHADICEAADRYL